MFVLYFLLALSATFIGSMTGMGGGIIMKPVMDALSPFSAADIGILSSVTVLSMSAFTCLRRIISKKKDAGKVNCTPWRLVLLAVGSVAGGYLGQLIFESISDGSRGVKTVQNIVMLILVGVIFFYMLFKEKLPCLNLRSHAAFALLGLVMGIISSFLGIGGGPLNVALLSFFLGMDIKTAVFASLLSVLFTQISKLATVLLGGGFGGYDLSALPFMVAGGILGAFIGSLVSKKMSPKATNILFCGAQILIFGICLYNIFS